jgi:hypothetical protein
VSLERILIIDVENLKIKKVKHEFTSLYEHWISGAKVFKENFGLIYGKFKRSLRFWPMKNEFYALKI